MTSPDGVVVFTYTSSATSPQRFVHERSIIVAKSSIDRALAIELDDDERVRVPAGQEPERSRVPGFRLSNYST